MWEFVCKKENPTFTAQKPVKCFSIILQGVSMSLPQYNGQEY